MLRQVQWIALSQLTVFILPVLLIPVLAHRLGVMGFASFVVLTGISQYTTFGVELGLNHAGLSELNMTDCPHKRRTIFTEIFYLKILLSIAMCVAVAIIVSHSKVSQIVDTPTLILILSGSIITCIIYPAWFFVLTGRLDINFKIAFFSRLMIVVLSLLIISEPKDYIKAVALFNFATIPMSALYVRKWLPNVGLPHIIHFTGLKARLINGFKLSGVMMRETITTLGVAPLYGLFISNNSLGLFAFAEKIAKLSTMPAPSLTSALMVAPAQTIFHLRSRLTKRTWWLGIAVAIILGYAAFAIIVELVIKNFFQQFVESIPLIYILALASPIVYFNYIELGMRYTKQGRFGASGRFSYAYIALLSFSSICLANLFGATGLAAAVLMAELMLMGIFIKARIKNA